MIFYIVQLWSKCLAAIQPVKFGGLIGRVDMLLCDLDCDGKLRWRWLSWRWWHFHWKWLRKARIRKNDITGTAKVKQLIYRVREAVEVCWGNWMHILDTRWKWQIPISPIILYLFINVLLCRSCTETTETTRSKAQEEESYYLVSPIASFM